MIYCDGFIFGCGGSYADKKASWERAAKEKLRKEEEEFLAQAQEEEKEQEIIEVDENLNDEAVIENIETIMEIASDDYCNEGM